jgi:hypothetical protein
MQGFSTDQMMLNINIDAANVVVSVRCFQGLCIDQFEERTIVAKIESYSPRPVGRNVSFSPI